MQQLNLDLFFPLTEQTNLDLDFTPCLEYVDTKRKNQVCYTDAVNGQYVQTNGNGIITTTNIFSPPAMLRFKPTNNSVGCWKVTDSLEFYSSKEPSWLHKQMSKIFFGWKWNKTK
jgi:hypothetical protein